MKIRPICLFLSFLIVSARVSAQVDPGTQNLRHSWTFEDGTANDYVGGANGYLMGGAEIKGGALCTDSIGMYLELRAEDVGIQAYSAFSTELWFQPDSAMNLNYHMFFYFGDSKNGLGYNGFFITPARGDNVSRAAISTWTDTPYQGEDAANGPEFDDGKLHHIVSTLTNAEINLFTDGAQAVAPGGGTAQGPAPLSSHNTIDALGPYYCYLAKSGYDGDTNWRGKILECNIYNRVLTSDEILFLFQKGPTGTTSVEEARIPDVPRGYGLLQNYPNPFNPGTIIPFTLQKKSRVRITVCDMLGRPVAELLDDVREAGASSVRFDASNLAGGVYLCRMRIDGEPVLTKKMMVLK
jgi:hypothetical protein